MRTGFWSGLAVSAPDEWELLGPGAGGAGEEDGFVFAVAGL